MITQMEYTEGKMPHKDDVSTLEAEGNEHIEARRYAEAMECYRQAAALGSALAARRIGYLYDNGFGVARDYEQAVSWYRRAIEKGDAVAMSNLGGMYQTGTGLPQNGEQALHWYMAAAENGFVKAMHYIAILHYKGKLIPRDKVKAAHWYEKAAENGFAEAMYRLADMYFDGDGVLQDAEKAVNLYRKAAEGDYAPAMYSLGVIFSQGKAVSKDFDLARMWLEKARAAGIADADHVMQLLDKIQDEQESYIIGRRRMENDRARGLGQTGLSTEEQRSRVFGKTEIKGVRIEVGPDKSVRIYDDGVLRTNFNLSGCKRIVNASPVLVKPYEGASMTLTFEMNNGTIEYATLLFVRNTRTGEFSGKESYIDIYIAFMKRIEEISGLTISHIYEKDDIYNVVINMNDSYQLWNKALALDALGRRAHVKSMLALGWLYDRKELKDSFGFLEKHLRDHPVRARNIWLEAAVREEGYAAELTEDIARAAFVLGEYNDTPWHKDASIFESQRYYNIAARYPGEIGELAKKRLVGVDSRADSALSAKMSADAEWKERISRSGNSSFDFSSVLPDSGVSETQRKTKTETEVWRMNGAMRENLKVSSDGERYYDPDDAEWKKIKK